MRTEIHPYTGAETGFVYLRARYYDPATGQFPGLSGVVSVSGGYSHSVAARSDGTVWAWGYNGYGQVGNNTPSPTPTSRSRCLDSPA